MKKSIDRAKGDLLTRKGWWLMKMRRSINRTMKLSRRTATKDLIRMDYHCMLKITPTPYSTHLESSSTTNVNYHFFTFRLFGIGIHP